MWKIYYTNTAIKQLTKLQKNIQKRIKDKLDFYIGTGQPISFAKKLENPKIGEYRYRIGDYRIIFDLDEKGRIIIVAMIGKRGEIYKNV